MVMDAPFSPNTHIAEAARSILANELDIFWAHHGALLDEAQVVAVHETRKALRRTFTAVKVFHPYFQSGLLKGYRRQLRKIMRRLARCRDIDVFLLKLDVFEEDHDPLPGLRQRWQEQKRAADDTLSRYLREPKRRLFLDRYSEFTKGVGLGTRFDDRQIAPCRVRHLAPLLIQERLTKVRAYDDYLVKPPLDLMHRLRIQFKELRYTLGFFDPVLGPEIEEVMSTLKALQDLLGDLNDARVAIGFLEGTPGLDEEVSIYRAAKESEIRKLLEGLPQAWNSFDSPAWRQKLGSAMAVL